VCLLPFFSIGAWQLGHILALALTHSSYLCEASATARARMR
jgi:hypothetical protein